MGDAPSVAQLLCSDSTTGSNSVGSASTVSESEYQGPLFDSLAKSAVDIPAYNGKLKEFNLKPPKAPELRPEYAASLSSGASSVSDGSQSGASSQPGSGSNASEGTSNQGSNGTADRLAKAGLPTDGAENQQDSQPRSLDSLPDSKPKDVDYGFYVWGTLSLVSCLMLIVMVWKFYTRVISPPQKTFLEK